jgi:PAS domain-containing protein
MAGWVENRRVFWQGALVLYLVPVLLIAWQADDLMVPALMALYGVLSLLVFARLMPRGEVVRVEAPNNELEKVVIQRDREVKQLQVELDKRAEKIAQLDGSVKDLTYEIRTLLKLEEAGPQPVRSGGRSDESWVDELPDSSSQQVRTQYDAYILLQQSIQRAQQLPGGFGDMVPDHSAMEMRQLFDAFRDETAAIVMVYSRSEGQPLFVNAIAQAFLGIEPEVFAKNFEGMIRGGKERWQRAIQGLGNGEEAAVRLIVAARDGGSLTLDCCMGVIPSGPFKGLAVAVLYREN